MKTKELIFGLIRGAVKAGTFGTLTPVIEAGKKAMHKPVDQGAKSPHNWASIFAQIGTSAYIFLGTETGRSIIKQVLANLGIVL